MRETCARVLAAALMTGAIAFAVGMPALFGTAHDRGRSLLAPPSSLQRSVRAPALPAPRPGGGSQRAAASTAQGRDQVALAHQLFSPKAEPGRHPHAGKPAPTVSAVKER